MGKSDEITGDDLAFLQDLEIDTTPKQVAERTPREQRIIAGFEDIQRFVAEHGRVPQHDGHNIFERIYAVRLEALQSSEETLAVLDGFDPDGILAEKSIGGVSEPEPGEYSDSQLLESLGFGEDDDDLTRLTHVRSTAEKRAAAEIANRIPCKDFDVYKPLFATVQSELNDGYRITVRFKENASIEQGEWFILEGQKAYVESSDEEFTTEYGRPDRRLRVIFDNGTESDLLFRSLQRALHRDKTSRRIIIPDLGPLSEQSTGFDDDDLASGSIYVLRSQSDHPVISEHRDVIHKIGVTTGKIEQRIAGARKSPTYLRADVEVVCSWELANINAQKLESVLHRFFREAQLDLALENQFSDLVAAREWFLVPLSAIREAVDRVRDGTLASWQYDRDTGSLREVAEGQQGAS